MGKESPPKIARANVSWEKLGHWPRPSCARGRFFSERGLTRHFSRQSFLPAPPDRPTAGFFPAENWLWDLRTAENRANGPHFSQEWHRPPARAEDFSHEHSTPTHRAPSMASSMGKVSGLPGDLPAVRHRSALQRRAESTAALLNDLILE